MKSFYLIGLIQIATTNVEALYIGRAASNGSHLIDVASEGYSVRSKTTVSEPEGLEAVKFDPELYTYTDLQGGVLEMGNFEKNGYSVSKLKLMSYYRWSTIASNTHWSNWHPASCAFDNTKSSQPTQQKFTTWVKHGTTGSAGFSLGVAEVAAINAHVDVMKETDDVKELDETVPARSWGQEWHRWRVFQTRQRRETCYHIVIGSGHRCKGDFQYFDTYTPIKSQTQRAWRTDSKFIDRSSCGNSN